MPKQSFFQGLYFKLLRKLNDGVPSTTEVVFVLRTKDIKNTKILQSMAMYSVGASLEEIATFQDVTRERIRQHLLKGCRHEA